MYVTKRLSQVNGWCLDQGLQRENNEDYLSIVEVLHPADEGNSLIGIYAVADGVGGMAHGERASRIAASTASQAVLEQVQSEAFRCYGELNLENAVITAHKMVQRSNAEAYETSGTTLVLAVIVDDCLYVANVGDSRAYLVSRNEMTQLSQDHSFVAELVAAGAISKEESEKSPFRSTLTQAIGQRGKVEPSFMSRRISAGDYLLLCTDGLHSQVDEARICQIIQSAASPTIACQELAEAANNAGGYDNTAIILIRMQSEG